MAMTVGDASDVQVLIHHVYGLGYSTGHLPSVDDVEAAAHRLAERSHKVLGAGLTSRDLLTKPIPA